jgi:hypothetical protein
VKHPWATSCGASSQHIPLGIYLDECKFGQAAVQDKILAVFISLPLWRPKKSRDQGWLLWSCRTSRLEGNLSIYPVLHRIVFECNCLFYGTHPTTGLPITLEKKLFVVSELRADWKQHKETWNFKSSWIATLICFRCFAQQNRSIRSYLEFDENAEWMATELDHVQFIVHMLKESEVGYCGSDVGHIKLCAVRWWC